MKRPLGISILSIIYLIFCPLSLAGGYLFLALMSVGGPEDTMYSWVPMLPLGFCVFFGIVGYGLRDRANWARWLAFLFAVGAALLYLWSVLRLPGEFLSLSTEFNLFYYGLILSQGLVAGYLLLNSNVKKYFSK